LLQHKIYQQAVKVPEELKEIINEETYHKARVYGLDKSSFSIIKELFDVTTTVVRLIFFSKIMQDRHH
jgi:STE24 endopeptidase